jgi:hypothetical protein
MTGKPTSADVNMGLRYEFATPIYEANNQLSNFNPATQTIVPATSSNRYTINPNDADFGPGLAHPTKWTHKTVVRGGFGISYSHWNRVRLQLPQHEPAHGVVALQVTIPGTGLYNNVQSGFPANMVSPTNYNPRTIRCNTCPPTRPIRRCGAGSSACSATWATTGWWISPTWATTG